MKNLKPVLAGGVIAIAAALPLQSVAGPNLTPAQACHTADLAATKVVLKKLVRGLIQVCKGKPAASISPRITKSLNKAFAKANAVHSAVDCATNQDPDGSATWPKEVVTEADVTTALYNVCDGV